MIKLFFILFTSASALIFSGCSLQNSQRAGLEIKTVPEATVTINGESKGTTPYLNEDLAAGTYNVKLESSSGSWEKEINIESGTIFYINLALAENPDNMSGELVYLEKGRGVGVISSPNKAEVSLNGQKQGLTPYLVQSIPEGEHEVVITKEGYETKVIKIKGSNGHKIMIEAQLKSQNAAGESTSTPEASSSSSASPTASTSASPTTGARATASPSSRVSSQPQCTCQYLCFTLCPGFSFSQQLRHRHSLSASSSANNAVKGTVTVQSTSTGWLRVRDKAGLEGQEIAKIDSGEKVDYIEQTSTGWTKIVLEDGSDRIRCLTLRESRLINILL
ncbi:MAG: hypothetical protein KatS3mg087_1617 [Patescibacteria group bacterium]|nr:MAG: hypothetical protein KatS3mg087_1617 [Patescibacteria group bacterium]